MRQTLCFLTVWAFAMGAAVLVFAGEAEKYTLRYKFQPGETLRWEVEHRSNVRTSVSGTTQTAETASLSQKAWRVAEVKPDGSTTFEHRVEWVDMRQKLTGRDEVRYDSRTDKKPPVGFEGAAKSVGTPLSIVTMDGRGKVLHRQRKGPKPQQGAAPTNDATQNEGWMTIPLPDGPVPLGHTWSVPSDIDVPLESGAVKHVKAIQQFTLEDVKTGVATIRVSTEVLTPITDPKIESQLVQREAAGHVRFDIDAGRILSQQMDIDKHVVGFRGDASSIHYVNRFCERLVTEQVKTAGKSGDQR
jgi:hypothetical protein